LKTKQEGQAAIQPSIHDLHNQHRDKPDHDGGGNVRNHSVFKRSILVATFAVSGHTWACYHNSTIRMPTSNLAPFGKQYRTSP